MARQTAVRCVKHDEGHGDFLLPLLRWWRADNGRLRLPGEPYPDPSAMFQHEDNEGYCEAAAQHEVDHIDQDIFR